MPPRIHPIHRIPSGIGIAVGPHARLGDLPPVGLEEHQKVGVVSAGVEILKPRLGIIALADPAFGHFIIYIRLQIKGLIGRAIGPIDAPFGLFASLVGRVVLPRRHGPNRSLRVAVLGGVAGGGEGHPDVGGSRGIRRLTACYFKDRLSSGRPTSVLDSWQETPKWPQMRPMESRIKAPETRN